MPKLNLTSIDNLQNETTAVAAMNNNSTATENALDLTLSRNGAAPNQMLAQLDMNSNRIINLPAPASSRDPIRSLEFEQFLDTVGDFTGTLPYATVPEANAGTSITRVTSPQRVRDFLETGDSFKATGTGAVNRPITDKLKDMVSVKDFGAKGDDFTDDTAAFNAALAANETVYIPAGLYVISGTIIMGRERNKLIGAGQLYTTLRGTTTDVPMLQLFNTGVFEIVGMAFTRTNGIVPTSNGHGIQQVTNVGYGTIRDVFVTHQYYGMAISGTIYGLIERCNITNNQNDGILMAASGGSPTQWQLRDIAVTGNGGCGIQVKSFDNTDVTLGEPWLNITTFANTLNGIRYQGSPSYAINNIILQGGFFGSDGGSEIFLDTYAGGAITPTIISHISMENAGNNTTGPLGTTPPTHTANGIEITQNNGAVHITGVSINGVTKSAILTSGPMTVVNGGSAVNCGVGLASGERNGVFVAGGSAIVTNYSAGNTPGVTYQQYGVFLGPASSNNIVIANDLHYKDGNTVVGLFDGSSVPTSNTLLSNKGDPQSKLSVPTVLSKGYTVATLPTATTTLLGARAFVTDASSPTFGAALTGGGSLVTPVYCNGGLWLVG